MYFSYDTYYWALYQLPLGIIIFNIVAITDIIAVGVYRILKRKIRIRKVILEFSIPFIVLTGLLVIYSTHLNISIKNTNPDNLVTVTGEIESINEVLFSPKFGVNNETVNACYIYIDGEEYYIMSIDDFQVGDLVEIRYLEGTNIIMSIHTNLEQ